MTLNVSEINLIWWWFHRRKITCKIAKQQSSNGDGDFHFFLFSTDEKKLSKDVTSYQIVCEIIEKKTINLMCETLSFCVENTRFFYLFFKVLKEWTFSANFSKRDKILFLMLQNESGKRGAISLKNYRFGIKIVKTKHFFFSKM